MNFEHTNYDKCRTLARRSNSPLIITFDFRSYPRQLPLSLSLCLSLLVSYASLRIYTGFSLEMRGKKSWRDKCPESCAWLFMLLLLLLEFVSLSAYIIIQHNWLLLLLWLLNYSFHAAYTTDLKPEWAVSVWDMRKTTENPWWLDPWQIWYGGLLNNLAHDANFIIISSELCDVDAY